jgi:glycosyltransferase involved in cell wall biosynthesis
MNAFSSGDMAERIKKNNGGRIKIVRIITRLDLGGAQQSVLHLCRHLDRDIFEQVLLTGEGGLLVEEPGKISALKHQVVPELTRSIGISSAVTDLRAVLKIRKIIQKESPDIVHTHTPKAGTLGRWAAFLAGAPRILHTFHGFGFGESHTRLARTFYIFLERLNSRLSHQLIVVTQNHLILGRLWRVLSSSKGLLIREGIDFAGWPKDSFGRNQKKVELGFQVSDRIVGVVASMTPAKALHLFVRAAEIIAGKNPDAHFLIVGDGSLRGQIEQQILELGLKSRFVLTGWRRDVPEILPVMDVFLLSSLWEGLPFALIEAAHSEVPAVAFETDGISEILQDGVNGFLVPRGNVEILASKTLQLLGDEELRQRMGKQGPAISQLFDVGKMVREHQQLYMSLR